MFYHKPEWRANNVYKSTRETMASSEGRIGAGQACSYGITVRQFPRHLVQGISSNPLGSTTLCQLLRSRALVLFFVEGLQIVIGTSA